MDFQHLMPNFNLAALETAFRNAATSLASSGLGDNTSSNLHQARHQTSAATMPNLLGAGGTLPVTNPIAGLPLQQPGNPFATLPFCGQPPLPQQPQSQAVTSDLLFSRTASMLFPLASSI